MKLLFRELLQELNLYENNNLKKCKSYIPLPDYIGRWSSEVLIVAVLGIENEYSAN